MEETEKESAPKAATVGCGWIQQEGRLLPLMWLEHCPPLLTYHPRWPKATRDTSRTRLTNVHHKTAPAGPCVHPSFLQGASCQQALFMPSITPADEMWCLWPAKSFDCFKQTQQARLGTITDAGAGFQGTPASIIFLFLPLCLGQVQGVGPLLPSLRQGSALGDQESHR